MKKIYIILVLLVGTNLLAQAPTFAWGKVIGGIMDDHANAVAIDVAGNVFTVGKFSGTVDFNSGVGVSNLTSIGVFDIFITKTDSNGNFIWAKSVGNIGNDDAYAVKLDSSGNIFICGVYYNNCDMDPGTGSTVLSGLTSPLGGVSSLNDSFLLKLDPNGNFLWARALAKSQYNAAPRWGNYANALAIDDQDNVIVTGYFTGIALIADTVYYTATGTATDFFVMKYSPAGVIQWAKQIGSGTAESSSSIVADASGIYLTGHFNGILDFDPNATVVNVTPTGGYDAFLLKMSASGGFVWVKKTAGSGDEYGRAVTMNSNGDVFWGGNYVGTVDFDTSVGTNNLTTTGNTDNFISKLDTTGNYSWTYGFGGVNGDFLSALALDSQSNVYATGNFSGTVDFNSGIGTSSFTSNGGPDIYLTKVSSLGVFTWAWAFGGQSLGGTVDVGNAIALDSTNNLTLVGYLYSNVDVWFDPNFTAGSRITPNGAYDGFMLKLQSGTLGINDFESNTSTLKIYPNPTNGQFTIDLLEDSKITITNMLGQIVFERNMEFGSNQINIQDQTKGLYFVNANNKTFKLLKQ